MVPTCEVVSPLNMVKKKWFEKTHKLTFFLTCKQVLSNLFQRIMHLFQQPNSFEKFSQKKFILKQKFHRWFLKIKIVLFVRNFYKQQEDFYHFRSASKNQNNFFGNVVFLCSHVSSWEHFFPFDIILTTSWGLVQKNFPI